MGEGARHASKISRLVVDDCDHVETPAKTS
jgi:hypothetical protein